MNNKKVLSASIIFVVTMLLIFGGIFTLDVMANDDKIEGEYANDGNLPNYVLDLESYKIEPIKIGTTTMNGLTIDVGNDGRMFDWESDNAVAYVFVKAGSSGYLYDYTPASFSGSDLHGPLNPNGNYAGLSHITFYFAEVGSLEINKEFLFNDQMISENDIDANFNFEITVTGISEGSSYPEGYTLSGLGNETLIFDNLVAGMYAIEETSSGNEWEVNLTSQDVNVLPGEITKTTISNNYVPGSLRVDKEFVFNNQIINPNEVVADFNFEITVTGPLGYNSTKSGLGNDSLVFDNLVGGTYTITETSSGNEWEVDLSSQNTTILSGEETQVTFTNNYIPGQLEVTKEFMFNDQMVYVGELDADFNFEISVSGPLGYNLTKQGIGNETLIFDDLIAGSYTVQETSSGMEWEVVVGTIDATVISGQTTEVNFTNNLIPGSLEVTKEFLLPDGQLVNVGDIDADFNFEINVVGPLGYNSTKSGVGNETLLFENLPVGTYTVQETSSGIQWEVAVGSQETTVISGQTTEITFSNNYIPGQLEVTKEFMFNDQMVYIGELEADFNFEINVTGPLGYNLTKQGVGNETLVFDDLIAGTYTVQETYSGMEWEVVVGTIEASVISGQTTEVSFTNNLIPGSLEVTKEFLLPDGQLVNVGDIDADFNFEINVVGPLGYNSTKSGVGNETLLFENLPVGTYTVQETSSGIQWEVAVGSQETTVISGQTTEITFSNNYIPGQLEVTKEFMFNDQMVYVGELETDFNFEINVTGPLGYNLTKQGVGNETLVFDDLIAGTYTVQETYSGMEWEVVVGTIEASVISGQTTEVSFTNNLIPGSLEVTKEFLLPDGQLVNVGDIDADFNFEINVVGPLEYNSTKSGVGNETLLFENLPVGTYTVQETSSGIQWEVAVGSQETTVISGQTTEITFSNNYIPGQLEVTKEFMFNDQMVYVGELDADFNFEISVTGPLGYNLTKQGTGNETLIFDDLIAGSYTVQETSSGMEWEVVVGTIEASVISGQTTEVTITNIHIIMGETAWAAHDLGVYRYRDRGNWATYIAYDELENGIADIYAGQKEYVGYVEFTENGSNVEISIHLDGWAFEPDKTNLYVQDYEKAPKGNPSPGRFDYKDTESNYEATISVPLNMYYGIHLNVYETK